MALPYKLGGIMNKPCTMCKITKDISMFYRDKNKKSGRKSYCKECGLIMNRQWRKDRPDKYKLICTTKRTKEKAIESKLRSRKRRHDISDHYMLDLITHYGDLNHEDIPKELVEQYRLALQLKRALKLTRKLKPIK